MTSGPGSWGFDQPSHPYGGAAAGYPQPAPWEQPDGPKTAPPPESSVWPIWPPVSLITGVFAVALAALPFHVGMVGVAAGVGGFGAAVTALIRDQRRLLAVTISGIAVSVLAVGLGITLIFKPLYGGPVSQQTPAKPAPEASQSGQRDNQTADTLKNKLDLKLGAVDCPVEAGHCRQLAITVTATNRLDQVAEYSFAIAAFDSDLHQLASGTGLAVLEAHATEEVTAILHGAFEVPSADQLRTADYRIIGAYQL